MPQPAIGSAVTLLLGRERSAQAGVPEGALTSWLPILPAGGQLTKTESQSNQVNPNGYIRKGIPGPAGGTPFTIGVPMNPRLLLEWYQHLTGSPVTKVQTVTAAPEVRTLTFTGVTINGETVKTIFEGVSEIYEFRTSGSPTAGNIAVDVSGGASNAQSATALITAIQASSAHPFTATSGGAGVVTLTADANGPAYNSILTTETAANGAWTGGQVGALDVFTYTMTPIWIDRLNTSYWGCFGLPNVERNLVFGAEFQSITHEIGDNEEIPVTMEGMFIHGTLLSPGVAKVGNAGTYTFPRGPYIRGLVADPDAGPIWIKVTDDAPLLKFKALQALTEPSAGDFTAASYEFTVSTTEDDNGDVVATWQNLQSSLTGLDLGVFAENKDPLEIIWPGGATQWDLITIADIFSFELAGEWADPASTTITGGQRYTSAHWITRFRAIGAAAYVEKAVTEGSITFTWPLTVARGNLSRYAHRLDRDGQFEPIVELKREFVDRFFGNFLDRHERFDMQMAFEGRQLTAAHRESITMTFPSAAITKSDRPAAAEGIISEDLSFTGETNDAGDPPVTIVVKSDYNFTPAT